MPLTDWLRLPVILWSYFRARRLSRRWTSESALRAFQERQMTKHLRFLQDRSSYFRDRLEDVGGQWRALRPMTKVEMMDNFDTLNTRGIKRAEALRVAIAAEKSRDFNPSLDGITVGLSSGTSGHRGLFLASRFEQWRYAGMALAKILPGFWRQTNRVAFFLRANSNLYTSVRSRLLKFEYFDLFEPIEGQLVRLENLKPTVVIAPPSTLRMLADLKVAGRLTIQPRKIVSVAEVLDPIDQTHLEKIFAQTIHQVYQATEGFLASTCAAGTLHLNEDVMLIEKEWIDKEQGKFYPVITDFSRKTQPIVRYRLNDILTKRRRPCPCGSALMALAFVEGRSDDLFCFSSRQSGAAPVVVYPDFIRRTMLFSDQIKEYRVTQTGPDAIEVLYTSDAKSVDESIRLEFEQLAERLNFRLVRLHIHRADKIAPPMAGQKLRRIVNAAATYQVQGGPRNRVQGCPSI